MESKITLHVLEKILKRMHEKRIIDSENERKREKESIVLKK